MMLNKLECCKKEDFDDTIVHGMTVKRAKYHFLIPTTGYKNIDDIVGIKEGPKPSYTEYDCSPLANLTGWLDWPNPSKRLFFYHGFRISADHLFEILSEILINEDDKTSLVFEIDEWKKYE